MLKSRNYNFNLNGRDYTLQMPAAGDEQIEVWLESGQGEDFFPYWLALWPCSLGLFAYLKEKNLLTANALEVGCGNALIGQMWHMEGRPGYVLTDIVPEALAFDQHIINDQSFKFLTMDFGCSAFKHRFELIFGSEILYEPKFCQMLPHFFENQLAPGGMALLADPHRSGRDIKKEEFLQTSLSYSEETFEYKLNGEIQKMWLHIWKSLK